MDLNLTLEEMNLMDYEKYKNIDGKFSLLNVSDLIEKRSRTLLYGYTCDRDTWHVYLFEGVIYCVVYSFNSDPELVQVDDNSDFVPNKRLYPARCDYEFSLLLKMQGVNLPFTCFDQKEVEAYKSNGFYGETLAGHVTDLPDPPQACA